MDLILTVIVAISAFVATNLDDIFLLMVFFAHPDYKSSSIILGQVIGISCLILISFPAFIFKSFIPSLGLSLMGLFPLAIGLKQLWNLQKSNQNIEKQRKNHDKNQKEKESIKLLPRLTWLSVAIVTISNGADNIGVYAPLFSNLNLVEITLTVLIFLVMTGIWCFLGHFLVNKSALGDKIKKYGHILLPFVLIVLGVSIIIINLF